MREAKFTDYMHFYMLGRYKINPRGDGPSLEEQELARALALAEPFDPMQVERDLYDCLSIF